MPHRAVDAKKQVDDARTPRAACATEVCMRALVVAPVAVLLVVSPAIATHVEPLIGKQAKFALVNPFVPCVAPNTATVSTGAPACAPATPRDACALSAGGSGKVSVSLS